LWHKLNEHLPISLRKCASIILCELNFLSLFEGNESEPLERFPPPTNQPNKQKKRQPCLIYGYDFRGICRQAYLSDPISYRGVCFTGFSAFCLPQIDGPREKHPVCWMFGHLLASRVIWCMGTVKSQPEPLIDQLRRALNQLQEHRWRQFTCVTGRGGACFHLS